MANFDELTLEQKLDWLKSVGRDPESLAAAEEAARQQQYLSQMASSSKKPLGTLGEAIGKSLEKTKPSAESIVESLSRPGKTAAESAEVFSKMPRTALESAETFLESGLTQAEKQAASKLPVEAGRVFDPSAIKRDIAQRLLDQAAKGSKGSGVIEAGGIGVPQIRTSDLPAKLGTRAIAEYEPRIIKDVTSEVLSSAATKAKPPGLLSKLSGPLGIAAGVAEPTEMYDIEKEAKRMPITSGLKPGAKMYSEGGELFKEGELPSGRAAGITEYLSDKAKRFIAGLPSDAEEYTATPSESKVGAPIPKELESTLGKTKLATSKEEAGELDKILATPTAEEPQFKKAKPLEEKEEGFKPSTPLEKEAEEKKSDLEKSLAEASKVDLEERKKYSDILKDAIKQRDMSQLIAQLGKAGALIGSGISGTVERGTVTKPVGGEIFDKIIELAGQPISDAEKLRVVEKEEAKSNPKSSDSIAARAMMAELGIKVPESATAAFLEKQFPSISSLMARREATEQRKEAAKQRSEEIALRREEIAASRELKVGERRKELLAKEVTKLGESKPLQEQRAALDQFDAVEDKIRSFTKDPSFSFDTFKKAKYKGDLPGVSLPFAGRTTFYSPDARELDTAFQGVLNQAIRSFAGKAVTKNELERIRTQYEAGKFANEKDYLQAFADVKKAVKKGIQSGEKAFSKEALEEYESRGGRVLSLGEKTESKSLKQKNPQVQKYADEHFGGDYDKALEFLEKRRKR